MENPTKATLAILWPLPCFANNKKLVGRSFKYHRPRGIVTAGSEEPNAIMEIGNGAYKDPNTRATNTELYNGLEANTK